MDSILIQHWQLAYAVIALLFAVATLAAAQRLRVGEPPDGAIRGTAAVTAGALWPVMVIGMAQLWVVHRVAVRLRADHTRVPRAVSTELAGAH